MKFDHEHIFKIEQTIQISRPRIFMYNLLRLH